MIYSGNTRKEIQQQQQKPQTIKKIGGGRSQDGRGIGWGDHFLFYKFIERTTER